MQKVDLHIFLCEAEQLVEYCPSGGISPVAALTLHWHESEHISCFFINCNIFIY